MNNITQKQKVTKVIIYDMIEYTYRLWHKNAVNRIKVDELIKNLNDRVEAAVILVGQGIQYHEFHWTLHVMTRLETIIIHVPTNEAYSWSNMNNNFSNYFDNNIIHPKKRYSYNNRIKYITYEDINLMFIYVLKGYYTILILSKERLRKYIKNPVFIKYREFFKGRKYKENFVLYYNNFAK